jgi:Ca2+-binding EF-hand superfamily protein
MTFTIWANRFPVNGKLGAGGEKGRLIRGPVLDAGHIKNSLALTPGIRYNGPHPKRRGQPDAPPPDGRSISADYPGKTLEELDPIRGIKIKNLGRNLKAVLLAGAIILASPPPPAGARPPGGTQEQRLERQKILFSKMDKNRDGQVSLEEFLAYYQVQCDQGRRRFIEYDFRQYDRNGVGFITLQEFMAPVTVRDTFRALDKNRDGRISRDEFLLPGPLFRSMDLDNDGLVTWEEFWRVMSRIQK